MALVTLILMSTGQLGKATIVEVKNKYKERVHIKAASRNPDRIKPEDRDSSIEYVKASIGGERDDIEKALDGVDSVFIIAPDVENPLNDLLYFAQAAKETGVKHVLLQSAAFADVDPEKCTCDISKMYNKLEEKVKEIFPDVTVLRLPLFMENNFAYIKSVKANGKMVSADAPDKGSPYMAVEDGGKAAAAILFKPEDHKGKTYTLINDSISTSKFAGLLGEAIDKEVSYEQVASDLWKRDLIDKGIPKWQVHNYVELVHMINNSEKCMAQPINEDFRKLTSEDPLSVKDWCKTYAYIFK